MSILYRDGDPIDALSSEDGLQRRLHSGGRKMCSAPTWVMLAKRSALAPNVGRADCMLEKNYHSHVLIYSSY
jgi:hypothetical protein